MNVREATRYRSPATTGLTDILDPHVRNRPDARALVFGTDQTELSYGALAALAEDMATRLGRTWLWRGDAVGLVCANTAEFVIALLGAARAGLVVAPLDPSLPQPQMSARLEQLGAQAILAGPSAADAARNSGFEIPTIQLQIAVSGRGIATVKVETGGRATRGVCGGARSELTEDDALVMFTSGTTGAAKMIPLTNANVAASVAGICETYELGPGDATVAVMPLFHGHGLFAVLLASLASEGCVLLPERGHFSARTFWDDARVVGATWFSAVPTIHQILLERSEHEYPGPQVVPLRFVRSCSAPLTTAAARALAHTLGVPVLSAYGMTETTHQATSQPLPDRGPLKDGSVGRTTGVDLRIVDHKGELCPAGAIGEVWVHGPTVTRGYLADPAATADSFADGWFRTGDLGSLDEDGDLFLAGRIKNIINRGGEKISPEHVEAILAGCRGVTEAAVYPVPDPLYGERVGAAVVVSQADDVGSEEILQQCRGLLAPFEMPERLEIVASLPHTAKGALDRRAIRDRVDR
jgi:acyl-CoA synthetase (AMP-forming)/AMP-acid ligase II